jgi:hypothetical protein
LELGVIIINDSNDTNAAMAAFERNYQHHFNQNFPLHSFKPNRKQCPRLKWMTNGLVKSCNKKNKLYKCFKKSCKPEDKITYLNYFYKLKKLLRFAEKNYYDAEFKLVSDNLKKTWSLVNSLIKKKPVYDVIQSFVAYLPIVKK